MCDPDMIVGTLLLVVTGGAVALASDDLRARWWAAMTRRSS